MYHLTMNEMIDDREKLLAAMKEEYTFPGYYPITLIAASDLKFHAHLHAALEYEQEGAEFTIAERPSSKKNFVSYRIMVFVHSAEQALKRKEFLRALDGVLVMF